MKRILTIVAFSIFSVFGYGQTILGSGSIIDSVVITPIACSGGQTSAVVYINNSGNASYDLYLQNAGMWMQHPSYPIVSGTGFLTINSLSAGTKRIIVEFPLNSGVFDTLVFTISQPDDIISFNSQTNVSCFGGDDGSITFNTFLGTAGYYYSINGSSQQYSQNSNFVISNLSSGTYSVLITDTLGCSYANNPVVLNISQPSSALSASSTSSDYSGFGVSCNGGSDGNVSVSVIGGTPSYSYLWSNGATTNTISNISEGIYTCNVSDANGCVIPTVSVVIDEPLELTYVTSSTLVSCNGGSDGTAMVSISGGVSPYTYLWSNGANSQSINGLNAGIYGCTITDANGCSRSFSVIVSEPSTLLVLSIDSDSVSCNGGNDGMASVLVSGGFSPYTYLWSNFSTDSMITGLTGGNYLVTVTDSNNCIKNQSIYIGEPLPISIPISSTDVSCYGGNDGIATANPSGGTSPYTYAWSNSGPTTSINTGLSFGVYTVTVTDNLNCPSVSSSITINEPDPIVLSMDSISVSCHGGNDGIASVSVSGGTPLYTYAWSNTSSDSIITGLTSGSYSVTVIDANNCIKNESIYVDQPLPLIIPSFTTIDVSCNGGDDGIVTVNPSGGTIPYNYSWFSSGGNSQQEIGLSAGVYIVTVTDAMNCSLSSSVTVNEPTAIELSMDSIYVSCNGGNDGMASVLVSGGFSPYTYLWSNTSSDSIITGLTSGNYLVTVTDSNNCIKNQSIYIGEPLPISIPISSTDVSCNGGDDGIATAIPSGGTSPYTYAWSNSGPTTSTNTGLSAGVYIVTVTDSLNCPSISSSVTINEPSLITVIANLDSVSCFGGNDGQILLSVSGGNGNYTYLWSNTQTTQNATALISGNYIVEVTDSTNCQSLFSYDIYEPSFPLEATAIIQEVSCFGFSDGEVMVMPTGGTPPYNYSWPNSQNSQSLTNLPIGSYTCTITDANGCIAYATGIVTEPNQLSVSSSSSIATSCYGYNDGSTMVIPQGGVPPYTYSWSNGQTTQQAINLIAGTYNVMVFDRNSCSVSTSIIVGQPVQVSASLSTNNVLCNGDSSGNITVNNVIGTVGPYTYLWSNGNTTPFNQNLSADIYYVTIYDGNGCYNTFSSLLTEPLSITANISYSDISVNGASDGNISANISGGTASYLYNWIGPNNYTNTTSTINSLESGLYSLTVTDANSCSETFNQVINEPNCDVTISQTYIAPVCYGDMASVYWQNSGGLSPYSNTLISSDGTVLINGSQYDYPNMPLEIPEGVYDLVVQDASGCSAIWNIVVTTPDSIVLDLTLTDALCHNANNGTASVIINGGSMPYNINWGSVDPNLLIAGNYNIEVIDINGCSSGIINYTINEPLPLIIDSLATTLVSCDPGNDGTATIYGSGGVLPYSYAWSNGQTAQTAQSLTNGIYTAYLYDLNNCETMLNSIQIENAPQLDVSIQQTLISCPNSIDGALYSSIVSGTGPITYTWYDLSNPNTVISSDSNIFNLSTGGYSLIATDMNGCIDQETILLSDPTSITFNLNPNDITFNGANDGWINTISVTGGQYPYNYYWTGPNGYSSITQNITNLSPGTYNLTITDANGCSSSQSSVVNEPSCNVLISSTINQPLCFGDNGNIIWTNSGGGGSYTNTITNLNTNVIIYNAFNASSVQLSPASYALQVSDQYGCVDLVNIQIIEPDPIIANILTNDASCYASNDGSVIITPQGGTPGYTINYGGITPNALTAGTYSVVLTDANNCLSSPPLLSFTISEPLSISTTVTNTNVSCLGGADGSASVNVNGGIPPYSFSWSPNGFNTQTVSSLSSGNHYVLVTDASGCTPISGQDLVLITEPDFELDATFSTIDASCFGYSDGIAQILVTGGTAPYTYLWSNGSPMDQTTNLIAGNYSCVVTDANGCSDIFYTSVNEPSEIISNINLTSASCNGFSDGIAIVSPSGGTGTYNILWFDNSTNNSISGLQFGSYNVFITDNSGCSTEESPIIFDIEEPELLSVITSVITTPTCLGGANGSVSVLAEGGTPNYTYNWLDSLSNIISTDTFASNLPVGVYDIIVSDINNCVDTGSISLSSPGGIVPNITTTLPSCNGYSDGSATVNASGGTAPYTYLWSGGLGSSTETITGINATTTYYVSIADANGCVLTGFPVNIQEPDAISIGFSITDYNGFNVSCQDSSNAIITTSSFGGYAPYLFSSDGIYYSADSVFTNISEGWFVSYVKDANNCITVDSVDVTAPDYLDPNITVIDSIKCSGDNNGTLASIPQGGVGVYTYFWQSTFSIGDSISGLSEGSYSVEVTDDNGCVSTQTFFLGPNIELFTNIISTPVSCSGGSDGSAYIMASGGDMPYTFNWSNGIYNDSIQSLNAGNYMCIVTDSNGCTTSDTVSIVESLLNLSVNCLVSNVLCAGDSSGSAIAYATGGTLPYTYQWNDANSQIGQQANGLIADTFIVAVTDSALCTVFDTIIVNEPLLLDISIINNNISCYGADDGSLIAVVNGGILPYHYHWEGPDLYTSNLDSIDNLLLGLYIINIIDSNGCKIQDTSIITEPTVVTSVASSLNPSCFGFSDGELELSINGGIPPYSVIFALGSYSTSGSIIIPNLSAVSDTLYIYDDNGCEHISYVDILDPLELLIDSVIITNTTCFDYADGAITINGVGGTLPYTYELTDSSNVLTSISQNFLDLTAGLYEAKITDINNCFAMKTVVVEEPVEIEIIQQSSCYGSILVEVFNTSGDYQIFWQGDILDSVFIDNLSVGEYNVTVIDDIGCFKVDSFEINEFFNYNISQASCLTLHDGAIEMSNINSLDSPYSLFVNGDLEHDNVISSYTIEDLLYGDYLITFQDNNGCLFSENLFIDYVGGYDCINLPVVISPNNDGTNDVWNTVYDVEKEIDLTILNRWGIVEYYYKGNSISFQWDGINQNGDPLPSSDYYYIIKFSDNTYSDITGVITLIR